jgi:ATP-dependent helicase/nuclease subunit A
MGDMRPGLVRLWRPVGDLSGEDEDLPEAGEEGGENWLSRPDRDLADRLARQVREWLDTGFPLHKGTPRNASAGDVMILVRKRKDLAGLIVARLHARGAGGGRRSPAPGRAAGGERPDGRAALCAQPLDDLNLANLLVSPLIGWSQEDLLARGYRKSGVRLWTHLTHSREPATAQTVEQLLDLLRRADFEPPAQLLHWLLVGPWAARFKLVARLGREANDPIDELLNAAMAYATGQVPSLVGFLHGSTAATAN